MAEKLKLEPNVPVCIALKYPTGKIVDSQYGDEKQVCFSLVDGRTAYLSLGVAQSITNLGLRHQEPFMICKYWNGKRGQQSRINVWLTPEGEQQRAEAEVRANTPPPIPAAEPPSMLERQLAASIAEVQAHRDGRNLITRRPPAAETGMPAPQGTGTTGPVPMPARQSAPAPAPDAFTSRLVAQTDALIDAYAQCLNHADSHGNRIKPEDVRSLLQTVYIAMTKNGVSHAA